jgi:hypothetical protein
VMLVVLGRRGEPAFVEATEDTTTARPKKRRR